MINPDDCIQARGKGELQKHLAGKKIIRSQATLAFCFDCMGGYSDGKQSCEIPKCPLYPWMPYRDKKEK